MMMMMQPRVKKLRRRMLCGQWMVVLCRCSSGSGCHVLLAAVCLLHLMALCQGPEVPAAEQDASFWHQQGRQALRAALTLRQKRSVAKNVLLFVGDGMGVSTVTAARIYKGQTRGLPGEGTQLHFEKFPYVALAKTYSVDRQVTDSAATATAFLSGVKTNTEVLGYSARVQRRNCSHVHPLVKVDSLLTWSLKSGKSVGLVTTTRVTHATPAASYAHCPCRFWESDAHMDGLPESCGKDIAYQLVMDNSRIQVILGGGRRSFLNRTVPDPETGTFSTHNRLDGLDLTQEWLKLHKDKKAYYVTNAKDFRKIDPKNTDYLLGLFSSSHMDYELHRDPDQQPSLSEMTKKAIDVLSKNPKGFFLLVEGGKIDLAHHSNRAKQALTETVALDEAVGTAVERLRQLEPKGRVLDRTLVLVTADHSHVFNIAGYPTRGNDILGLVTSLSPEQTAVDLLPYTTLLYANGPGPGRVNLTHVQTNADDFQQSRLVPLKPGHETHGGEDVPVYGRGPMAHLLHGVHEQSYIAHVMAYAACVGPYRSPDCWRRDLD